MVLPDEEVSGLPEEEEGEPEPEPEPGPSPNQTLEGSTSKENDSIQLDLPPEEVSGLPED